MKNFVKWLTIFCVLGFFIPCAQAGDPLASNPMPVYVSILPQAYFVEQIGGDRVAVDVLIPPGKSPATYSPTPAQMEGLAKAMVYFRIGVPFENALMPKIKTAAPNTLVVDTRQGIRLRTMESGHHHGEDGDHEEEGHHGGEGPDHGQTMDDHARGKDPHIWLDPMLVKIQAITICQALKELEPENADFFQHNLSAFTRDLEILNRTITQALAPVKGSTVFVFHPSYGYLCDAFGLRQMAIEMEGKTPKGRELSTFIAQAKEQNVRVIFVQPQFDRNAAGKIARSINGVVLSLDPLAKDYIGNMQNMASSIATALKQ